MQQQASAGDSIGIIGLGSIGSTLAAYLKRKYAVHAYVNTLRNGKINLNKTFDDTEKFEVTIDSVSTSFTSFLEKKSKFIILTTKTTANKDIASLLNDNSNNITQDTCIVVAQNGIHNDVDFYGMLSEGVKNKVFLYRMVVTISSSFLIKNSVTEVIYKFFNPPVCIGPVLFESQIEQRITPLVSMLNDVSISAKYVDYSTIQQKVWEKGALNCCLNALSALYKMKMLESMKREEIHAVALKILNEVYDISKKLGITLDVNNITKLLKNSPDNFSSMFNDLESGKPTEIHYLNRKVYDLGLNNDVKTPVNKTISDMILAIEFKRQTHSQSNGSSTNGRKTPPDAMSCKEREFEMVKRILVDNKKDLLQEIKKYLNKVITKLYFIGLDKLTFFSDDKEEAGNIGIPTTEEIDDYFTYISNDLEKCTIREKINSIFNVIYDSKQRRPNVENVMKLINYIFLTAAENTWNSERIKQLSRITNIHDEMKLFSYIYTNKKYELWAPITIIYPSFVYKRQIVAQKGLIRSTGCSITENQLTEQLSEREKKFLDITDEKSLPFKTGECDYTPLITDLQTDYEMCTVAGISGHTMLIVELACILGFDWKPMLLAAILLQVPVHHSLHEIFDALFDMGLHPKVKNREMETKLRSISDAIMSNAVK